MSMEWSDERYIRVYTRDNPSWVLGPWQARAVLAPVMRKLDRAGTIDLGTDGMEALAVLIGFPLDVVEAGMAWWVKRGTFEVNGGVLVMPNFMPAQEASASDAQRQRECRARKRDEARGVTNRDGQSRNVTIGHEESQPVTPSCAVPNQTNQGESAPAVEGERAEREPEASSPPPSGPRLAPEPATTSTAPPVGGPLPDSVVHRERKGWQEAYCRAVAVGGGPASYVFPDVKFKALRGLVEARCKGEDRRSIPAWIEREVTAFVKDRLRAGWSTSTLDPFHPDALVAWENNPERRSVQRATVKKAPPTAAHLMGKPTMTAEETAAECERLQKMLAGVGS